MALVQLAARPPPLIDTSLPGALTDWMPPYAAGRGRLADKGVGDAGGVVADGAEAGIKSSIPPGLRALVDRVRAGSNPMREVLVQLLSQGASIPEAGVALAREELSRPDLNQGDAVVYGGVVNSSDGVGYFYARCIVRSDGAVEVVATRRLKLGARVVYSIHGLSDKPARARGARYDNPKKAAPPPYLLPAPHSASSARLPTPRPSPAAGQDGAAAGL